MKDLDQYRKEIDKIDEELIALFEKRMGVSKDIVNYKKEHGLPVFQPEREQSVIEKNTSRIKEEALKSYGATFIQDLMNVSKAYQSSFLDIENTYSMQDPKTKDIVIGYQGVEGAFSYQAMKEYFGDVPWKNYHNFEDVYVAIKNGEIDYGILPIENSSTGAVNDNYDLVRDYDCFIVGEHSIDVAQHLLVVPGTKFEDLKEVVSHPQALAQSSLYLSKYPQLTQTPYVNTAIAAKTISESQDKSKAAIASLEAAKLYNLEVLEEHIENATNNKTRFIVVSNHLEHTKSSNRVSIVFTLKHEAGTLYHILKAIKEQNINMCRIESRPYKDGNWQYYFYIDFEGNLDDQHVQITLKNMSSQCLTLKVLGNYEHA